MTKQELCKIEKREEQTTPGPWHVVEFVDKFEIRDDYYSEIHNSKDNRRFISCARVDVPNLCKEVRKLQREIESLRETLYQTGFRP